MASNIEVSVSAKTVEFTAGMALVQAQMRQTGAVMRDQAKEMLGATDAMKAQMQPALLSTADAYATLQAKMNFYRDGIRSSTAAVHEAAAAHGELSVATSGVTREFLVLGHEMMQGNFSRFGGSMVVLAERTNVLHTVMQALTPTMIAGGAAALAFAAGLTEIVLSANRAASAFDTARNAFSFKGFNFSDEALAPIVTQLRELPGVTTESANAIVRSFTEMYGATIPIMHAMADLLPEVMRGTGKDADAAAKTLIDEWTKALKASPAPEETAREFFGKYIQAISGMAQANAPAFADAFSRFAGAAPMAMLGDQQVAQAKKTADDIAAAIKSASRDIQVSDEAAAAVFKTTEDARAAGYRVEMALVNQNVAAVQAAQAKAQAAETARLASLKEHEDALAASFRTQMEIVSASIADARQYQETWEATSKAVESAFTEITKAGAEIAKIQGEAGGGIKGRGGILGLLGIGDAEGQAQQEIASLTSSMQQQLAEFRNSFAQAIPTGDFDQAIAALNEFKGGLADIPALMQSIGATDQTQFAAIIANLDKARVAQADFANEVKRAQAQAATATTAEWEAAFRPIGNAFESVITGMLSGAETFRQAMVKAADQIATGLISSATKGAIGWAASEVAKTMATDTGVATRTAVENSSNVTFLGQIGESLTSWLRLETSKTAATSAGEAARAAIVTSGSAVSSAVDIAKAMASISISAGEAAAAAFADSAMLGPAGLAAAPAVAAAAYSSTMAWGAGMGVAKLETGTFNVPSNIMAFLHAGEMVVPPAMSAAIRSGDATLGGPGAGGGGAPIINVTFAPAIRALDGKSVAALLNSPGIMRALVSNIGKYMNLNPSTRPAF